MTDEREVTAAGHAKGEHHGRAVLNWLEVRAMRHAYANSRITQRRLAEQYKVSQTSIHRILCNLTWHDPNYIPPVKYR